VCPRGLVQRKQIPESRTDTALPLPTVSHQAPTASLAGSSYPSPRTPAIRLKCSSHRRRLPRCNRGSHGTGNFAPPNAIKNTNLYVATARLGSAIRNPSANISDSHRCAAVWQARVAPRYSSSLTATHTHGPQGRPRTISTSYVWIYIQHIELD
jgi:hypothetical protein